ncbi:hypothetical protein GOP47_0025833 [Adiantum capillus-veneris]|uniref:Ubiquitin carboxyl-terminal hydrolase n=1 Tax=Adiantum capillus-veneris TaxID=13818 RepID=A0A9D4Z396_ADICA|nr:hypothetical protein GOP47_0025833 [Adiantum capillus-veneris]
MRRSSPTTGVANTLSFVRDAILSSSGYGGGHMQSWRDVLQLTHSLGLTLLGAGTVGAILLLRQLSPASALSWLLQSRPPNGFPDDSLFDPSHLTVPGLRNSGNNCFLNAILQALSSSCVVLSFLAAYGRGDILSLFDGVESRCISLPLTEALSDLLVELSELDPEPRVASPRHVMYALEPYAKQFDLSLQQDAAEALNYLADALQIERIAFFESFRAFRESISDASRPSNGIVVEDVSEKENSPLNSWKRWPLEGTIGSMLMCQECGYKFSTQFQSFHEVPLSPPQFSNGNIVNGCNLEACLEQFTAPECISNVRCSCCSHSLALRLLENRGLLDKAVFQRIKDCTFDDDCSCEQLVTQIGGSWKNVHVNAIKQLRFGRCPEVMCCQVQRVVVSSGELVKWTGHVSFPLVLNLQPFVMSSQGRFGKPFVQSKGPNEMLHEVLWPKRTSEMHSNIEFCKLRAPSSTDGSSSDDMRMSGSEDLASDTSSESMAGRSGDEIVEKHKEVSGISQWDSCQTYGLDSVLLSKLGHIPLDDKDQLLFRFRQFGDGAIATQNREVDELQQDDPCISKRWLYELISVVVHHGSSKDGHYTVYRKAKLKQSDFAEEEHQTDICCNEVMNSDDSNSVTMDLDDNISEQHDVETTEENMVQESSAERELERISIGLGPKALNNDRGEGISGASRASIGSSQGLPTGHAIVDSKFSSRQTLNSDKELGFEEDAHTESLEVEDPESKQPSKEVIVLWFRVSDSHVTLVTEEEVLMAQATLLFYERSVAKDSCHAC